MRIEKQSIPYPHHIAKSQLRRLLPYKGLGSGIKRALEDWQDISFTDDREGSMFIATVHRKEIEGLGSAEKDSQKSIQKSTQKIIELMQNDPAITIAELALRIGITEWAIKKQIRKIKLRAATSP